MLRKLVGYAHEEALKCELAKLQESFQEWKAGRISPFELSDMIHRFHEGPRKELFVKYVKGGLELLAADAVVNGLIPESAIPEELREHLAPAIEVLRGLA